MQVLFASDPNLGVDGSSYASYTDGNGEIFH